MSSWSVFFFQAEDGIRDVAVTGVQTCALPISDQFRAAIAFYPWCRDALTEPFRVPVLVLIGGSDDWTPAKRCEDMQARLGLVNADAPQLRVQVYQGAHHDFDDVSAKTCCGHTLKYKRAAAKDADG